MGMSHFLERFLLSMILWVFLFPLFDVANGMQTQDEGEGKNQTAHSAIDCVTYIELCNTLRSDLSNEKFYDL